MFLANISDSLRQLKSELVIDSSLGQARRNVVDKHQMKTNGVTWAVPGTNRD
jgi:hypothetical protein